LRLQTLAEKTGPGCGADGDFLLTDVNISAAPLVGKEKALNVKLRAGAVTREKKGQPLAYAVDADKKTGWSVGGGKDQAATFEFETPVGFKEGTILTVVLRFEGGSAIARPRFAITTQKGKAGLDAAEDLQHGPEVLTLLAGGDLEKNRASIAVWQR